MFITTEIRILIPLLSFLEKKCAISQQYQNMCHNRLKCAMICIGTLYEIVAHTY